MSISTPSLLDSEANADSVTSIVTDTIAPTANALLIAVLANIRTDTFTHDSMATTLSGVTFTKQDEVISNTQYYNRISIWTAQCGASPGTGTVTGNWSDAANRNCLAVYEVTGHDTASPVTQTKTNSGVGTSLSITLDSSPDSSACVFGAVMVQTIAAATVTAGTNYTEITEFNSTGSPDNVNEAEYDLTPTSTTVDWTFSDGDSNARDRAGVAIEIAVDSGLTVVLDTA